jgi:hypothetical protein
MRFEAKRPGAGIRAASLQEGDSLIPSRPSRLRAKVERPETKSFAFAASLSHVARALSRILHGGMGRLSESVERQAAHEKVTKISAALIAAVVIWNSLLLAAAIILIVRRRQVIEWITGADRLSPAEWDSARAGDDEWLAFLAAHPELDEPQLPAR